MKILYFITDSTKYADEDAFFEDVFAALRGGVDRIQLREKNLSDEAVYERARIIKKEADKYHTPLIIDDRVGVAKKLGVGVHLGDDDMAIKEARAILGRDALIGVSVKTVQRAREAEKEGASYFGTGALFPTRTKVVTRHTSMDTFRAIKKSVSVPVYAIGGINEKTLPELKDEDFDGICVVSAIQYARDPEEAVKNLRAVLSRM
ncbi:MAG: thiamine phosphate synthase [Peptoniphilus sp.]|nr:thiamine phosphate synthase [Peptoniphilus sp.]MDY3119064.1 thiamine phosphate synthase [Peptoniphilus sp.]